MSSLPQLEADPAEVTRKAVLRAAEILDLTQESLGKILGLSEASVSRLRHRQRTLDPRSKEGELALLLVRLYRSLDAMVGGDDQKARAWFHSVNTHLRGVPAKRAEQVEGLVDVIQYLDAMRGVATTFAVCSDGPIEWSSRSTK